MTWSLLVLRILGLSSSPPRASSRTVSLFVSLEAVSSFASLLLHSAVQHGVICLNSCDVVYEQQVLFTKPWFGELSLAKDQTPTQPLFHIPPPQQAKGRK